MGIPTRKNLGRLAEEMAKLPFHGNIDGKESNIAPIIAHFPKWNVEAADRAWCAAFVYYCCVEAGFKIPYSPDECVSCSLAGCGGWDEFAQGDKRIGYHKRDDDFSPEAGDIVIFDRAFCGKEHDHIGIIIAADDGTITSAEGNIPDENISGIIVRKRDDHIRAYIRIPDGFEY